MSINIRPATQYDHIGVEKMLYSAGPELYDFLYQHKDKTALEFIQYEFQSGRGHCGYRYISVAELDGELVATGSFYNASEYIRMTVGTIANVFSFYGFFTGLNVLIQSRHISSVMRAPGKDEIYVANIGVKESMRGKGVGSQLILKKKQEAEAESYKLMSLDVATHNPNAQRLYERLGFTVHKANKRFSGKMKNQIGANEMVLNLE